MGSNPAGPAIEFLQKERCSECPGSAGLPRKEQGYESRAPTEFMETDMKTITFKNRFNGERVVCKDTKAVQVIDGIEYLLVSKTIQDRKFLMRKDALERVNASVV